MWLIKLIILAVYAALAYFLVTPWDHWLRLILGLGLGWLVLFIDEHFLIRYYRSLNTPGGQRLISRSILFLAIFILLTIYMVMAGGSLIGIGIMIAMTGIYTLELFYYRRQEGEFQERFLWQTKIIYQQSQRDGLALFFIIWWLLLLILGLWQ